MTTDIHTTPPTDRHVQRAEVMAASGSRAEAAAYLAHLAAADYQHAADVRQNGRADETSKRREIERINMRGDRYAAALTKIGGTIYPGAPGGAVAFERAVTPTPLPAPRVAHPVANPFWPALRSHGLFIGCDDRTAQRRGLWLDLQLLFPDMGRTSLVLGRREETAEAALATAGRWAAIGFAALAAETALQDREGVVFAAPAPSTPDTCPNMRPCDHVGPCGCPTLADL